MTPKQACAAYERETSNADLDVALKKDLEERLKEGPTLYAIRILKRLSSLLAEKDVTKRTYYEEMALEGIDDALKLLEPKS